MHWTDMSEKEMIKAWAVKEFSEKLQHEYLPQPDSNKESYWTGYENEKNIVEYDFSSVSELLALLRVGLMEENMEDLIRPLAVAAFKQRAKETENGKFVTETGEDAGKIEIPEFIYNF
ncbi:hypothetical protein D7V86_01980 [bacterium D16-51]|nr:hypothetical protein D7V96_01405 [bacterium D16-59]RKI62309.1 hypothetical protein D7V86_01980 [bacterium D16-51]